MDEETMGTPCQWTRNPALKDWHTTCDHGWYFDAKGNPDAKQDPTENLFTHCPFCGRRIEQVD